MASRVDGCERSSRVLPRESRPANPPSRRFCHVRPFLAHASLLLATTARRSGQASEEIVLATRKSTKSKKLRVSTEKLRKLVGDEELDKAAGGLPESST